MRLAVFCDVFPELSETFVVNELRALRREGHEVTVVAIARPRREHVPTGLDVRVLRPDETPRSRKLLAGGALALRHPVRCAHDLRDRRSWRPDQPRRLATLAPIALALERSGTEHIHVHFAAGASVEGLRVGALLGVPVSITAHAHEIFRSPRHLERKLRSAAFATSGCRYNVAHLRGLVDSRDAERIHVQVMGVDAGVFRRTRPHPEQGRVLAVGRLVEKKGFADLVRAAAGLRGARGFTGVTIVGEGPLEGELRALAVSEGAEDLVELAGPRTPAQVRDLLEEVAVLAMPCVVAADGDRDSMPVVVKEALAMEVPVVATREVGLPEIVDESCGRLVAPHDAAELQRALADLLSLTPTQRAVLGRAGRERMLERCDVHVETGLLLRLIADARRSRLSP